MGFMETMKEKNDEDTGAKVVEIKTTEEDLVQKASE